MACMAHVGSGPTWSVIRERSDRNESVERLESLLAKPEICVAALFAAPKAGVLCPGRLGPKNRIESEISNLN
jgi:hypothetical protein